MAEGPGDISNGTPPGAAGPPAATTADSKSSHQDLGPLNATDLTIVSPAPLNSRHRERIVFVIEGWACAVEEEHPGPLQCGSVLAVPAGVVLRLRPQGVLRVVVLQLNPKYLVEQLKWLPSTHPLVHQLHRNLHETSSVARLDLPPRVMPSLVQALQRTADLSKVRGSEFALLASASEVFDIVGRIGLHTHLGHCLGGRLPRRETALAVRLMRTSPCEDWTVAKLAREVVISASQLTRIFRADLGISPAAYLRQIRVDLMAELLSSRVMRVGEAAQQAGWNNPTAAARAFKKRFGVSPSSFSVVHHKPQHDEVA